MGLRSQKVPFQKFSARRAAHPAAVTQASAPERLPPLARLLRPPAQLLPPLLARLLQLRHGGTPVHDDGCGHEGSCLHFNPR